jgi:hypothetical protein
LSRNDLQQNGFAKAGTRNPQCPAAKLSLMKKLGISPGASAKAPPHFRVIDRIGAIAVRLMAVHQESDPSIASPKRATKSIAARQRLLLTLLKKLRRLVRG